MAIVLVTVLPQDAANRNPLLMEPSLVDIVVVKVGALPLTVFNLGDMVVHPVALSRSNGV